MDKVNGKLTVFFEEPFWVGIFERIEDGKLSVAKVTFGAEPKDYEVQEYIQKAYFSSVYSPYFASFQPLGSGYRSTTVRLWLFQP